MVGDSYPTLWCRCTDQIIANDPLKKFSKTYSVKLEASKKQGMIRVESDFTTSEDVVRMFIHILGRIKSSVIPTGAVELTTKKPATKDLDTAYLKEVARLTNTIIVKPVHHRSGPKIDPREVRS